jgi:hypothetical protein
VEAIVVMLSVMLSLSQPRVTRKVVVVVTVMTTETGGQAEGVALNVVMVEYVPPAVRVWSVVGATPELA